MRKILIACLIAWLASLLGCGNHDDGPGQIELPVEPQGAIEYPEESSSCLGENCTLDLDDGRSLNFVSVKLALVHPTAASSGSLNLTIYCSDVYDEDDPNDWTQTATIATMPNDQGFQTGSVSIISGAACTIQINSWNDGTNTWTPNSAQTYLLISISGTGVVGDTSAPVAYTTGSLVDWFYAGPNGSIAYSVIIYTQPETIATGGFVPATPVDPLSVTLTVLSVPPPTVSEVGLFYVESINGQPASYTLTASAQASVSPPGTLGCKYIDNTQDAISPTSWSQVNAFFVGTSGTACPTMNLQGNWDAPIYDASTTYLIVFANTVGNLSSYVTYSVP